MPPDHTGHPPTVTSYKGHQRPCETTGQPSQWVCLSLYLGVSTGLLSSSCGPRGEDPPDPPDAMRQGRFQGTVTKLLQTAYTAPVLGYRAIRHAHYGHLLEFPTHLCFT